MNKDIEKYMNDIEYYINSYDKDFNKKYDLHFYLPYIEINEKEITVIRIAITNKQWSGLSDNMYRKLHSLNEKDIKLLNKILPIYYKTYDLNQSIIDVYYLKFINLIKNRRRQLKLNTIKESCDLNSNKNDK